MTFGAKLELTRPGDRSRWRRNCDLVSARPAQRRVGNHRQNDGQKEIGRRGKQRARLPQTTQVGQRDQKDRGHGDGHAVGRQGPDQRSQRKYAGRDRHGHSQHVIGQQGGTGDQTRQAAQIFRADNIRAAAFGIGRDRLAVRKDHDHQQQRDQAGERTRVLECRRAQQRRTSQRQMAQNFLRCICRR